MSDNGANKINLGQLAQGVRIPTPQDAVHNEECLFSFDDPESKDGLFVCLKTFAGFSKDHATKYSQRTGNKVRQTISQTIP